ncbi:GTP-binding protein [Candidatus Sulfurimonas marisnigri]|uniref:GTP-binding protein n=1 Tax=Candidatus Sulfurimonas marisnigri TaxID=2740405 RepID=A0A7S7LYD6_9BACT|nr:putative glycoside hydrolase [Candidatus Sulfurimonas marisnigri]QOY53585.1 GTP-binding protein [Candidatus Sulfurimonas marisnigri]
MKLILITTALLQSLLFASFSGNIVDKNTSAPIINAIISDSIISVKSDENGSFTIDTNETNIHIKAYGYRPYKINFENNTTNLKLESITVKALYLTFWAANTTSKRIKKILNMIDDTEVNALVIDIKNEYGSTVFKTSFEQANSYGAHKNRTNRDIENFMQLLKSKNIYTIARIVTFKDELQASNNPDYAIKKIDGTIWRNHDNMAWVDPYDVRSHEYAISMAEEAAKVGFDEINFDYIRFPAKAGLKFCETNNQENRVKTIGEFLDLAQSRLRKYGVFISVDTYGNICWSNDDNNIGQTVLSLAKHADYISPMLYPSGFASGSFYFEYPSEHPYAVIYRSIKNIKDRIDSKRVRPWLQYFKDYAHTKRHYRKFEVREQIRATEDINTSGWMMWSPSSRYHLNYFVKEDE